MAAEKTCGTCRWWDDGACSVNPPIVVVSSSFVDREGETGFTHETVWPQTEAGDWCGRWEKSEGDNASERDG